MLNTAIVTKDCNYPEGFLAWLADKLKSDKGLSDEHDVVKNLMQCAELIVDLQVKLDAFTHVKEKMERQRQENEKKTPAEDFWEKGPRVLKPTGLLSKRDSQNVESSQ
jgi:hypothetical protein